MSEILNFFLLKSIFTKNKIIYIERKIQSDVMFTLNCCDSTDSKSSLRIFRSFS